MTEQFAPVCMYTTNEEPGKFTKCQLKYLTYLGTTSIVLTAVVVLSKIFNELISKSRLKFQEGDIFRLISYLITTQITR